MRRKEIERRVFIRALCFNLVVLRRLLAVIIVRQAFNKSKTNLCETPSIFTVETGSAMAINAEIVPAQMRKKSVAKSSSDG